MKTNARRWLMAAELLLIGAPITLYWLFGLVVFSFGTFQDRDSAAALLLMFLLVSGIPIAALWRLGLVFIVKGPSELVSASAVWWVVGKIGLLFVVLGGMAELTFTLNLPFLKILLLGLPFVIPGIHLLAEFRKAKQLANKLIEPTP